MGSLAGELQVSSISDSDLSMVCVLLLLSRSPSHSVFADHSWKKYYRGIVLRQMIGG